MYVLRIESNFEKRKYKPKKNDIFVIYSIDKN